MSYEYEYLYITGICNFSPYKHYSYLFDNKAHSSTLTPIEKQISYLIYPFSEVKIRLINNI